MRSNFQEIGESCQKITETMKNGRFSIDELKFMNDWFKGFWNLTYAKIKVIEDHEKTIKAVSALKYSENN